MGVTTTKEVEGKKITYSIVPNPSHLEAVNPLVYGRVRAIQDKMRE
jgi:2-oxoglutarate dehydrogenase E1 component